MSAEHWSRGCGVGIGTSGHKNAADYRCDTTGHADAALPSTAVTSSGADCIAAGPA
jgi:hypothetical protein